MIDRSVTIFHISDLHFGHEDNRKRAALLHDIDTYKPEIICVTGDIVEFPWPWNFSRAKDFLSILRNKCNHVFVVPGNHDALFGGWAVKGFRYYVEDRLGFVESRTVNGIDFCFICINSTWPSLSTGFNQGRVTKKRVAALEQTIKEITEQIGELRFRNAVKIALLHHHPLPTISGKYERVLQLKNSGAFLQQMANWGVEMVLHGHRHNPAAFSIDYNVGGRGDGLVVISAGSTLRRTSNETGISQTANYYRLDLRQHAVAVYNMAFDTSIQRYITAKSFSRTFDHGEHIAMSVEIVYEILADKSLRESRSIRFQPRRDVEIRELPVRFGVDAESSAADFSSCSFQVQRDGPNGTCAHHLIDETEREKKVRLVFDPPLVNGETVSWEYVWPGGWERFFDRGQDEGEFYVNDGTDHLRIVIANRHRRTKLALPTVQYAGDYSLSETADQVFTIEVKRPKLNHYVRFLVRASV